MMIVSRKMNELDTAKTERRKEREGQGVVLVDLGVKRLDPAIKRLKTHTHNEN